MREPIEGVGPASSTIGVWRVDGRILKHVGLSEEKHRYWVASSEESDALYWRREPLLYRSGFLDTLRGLRPPQSEVVELEDGTFELWLEDLEGTPGKTWSLSRFEQAARELGAMQGEFAAGRPLPDWPWLSRGWLRAFVEKRTHEIETFLARRDAPAVRSVWENRYRLLAAVEAAPRTFCHLDVWPPNFWDVGGETVLFDWAFAGHGALGEDLGNLVPDTTLDGLLEVGRLPEIDATLWEAYVAGLREAGWGGDLRSVHRAYAASAALKFVWIVPRTLTSHPEPHEHWLTAWDYLAERAADALRES